MDVRILTDVMATVAEVASAVTYQDSLYGSRHVVQEEEIVLNKMFHCYSISFTAQRLSPLVSMNILVILSWTSTFHKLIAVTKPDSRTTKEEILDSELCTLLAHA